MNKTGGDLTSPLSIAGFTPAATAQVWRYGPANLAAVTRETDLPLAGATLTTTFPANSITLLVVGPSTPVVPDAGAPAGGADGGGTGPAAPTAGAVHGLSCDSTPGAAAGMSLLVVLALAVGRRPRSAGED